MLKPLITSLALLFLSISFTAPAFAEQDATMHEVYLAAEAGKFNEAQSMMDKVLRDHPNSAKAHFVEAELLAKQGLLSNAAAELKTAEQLQPRLPFAKPEAVQHLKSRIGSTSQGTAQPNSSAQNLPAAVKSWLPTVLLILGFGLIVLLISFMMSRRNAKAIPSNSYAGANAPGANMPPAGPATGQGGMGSGIMGNLATGAALGAGLAAGEALVHHFIDGDKNNVIPEPQHGDSSPWNRAVDTGDTDDMGGSDFGIEDNSSWDDDSAGGDGDGDDWN